MAKFGHFLLAVVIFTSFLNNSEAIFFGGPPRSNCHYHEQCRTGFCKRHGDFGCGISSKKIEKMAKTSFNHLILKIFSGESLEAGNGIVIFFGVLSA